MQDLTVTLIQTALYWEDIDANIALFDRKIDDLTEKTDLIVLPEMFTTGFTMNAQPFAQDMDGPSVLWIRKKARQKGTDITGSMIIEENGNYYNRLIWAKPDGRLFTYDKEHLFRFAGEEQVYSTSHRKLTIELNGWKIRPFVCYDLRFPIWTRNLDPFYDLAVFIANWPEKRADHWRQLLQARAIENLCYVVGVNRIGKDGNGYPHRGDSAVIDPKGNIIFQNTNEDITVTKVLSHQAMSDYRNYFPALLDADHHLVP